MGPLSIRIPIYPGQIPPRGARISKLSLKIWIFRFGRVNPLLAAANPELIPSVFPPGAQNIFSGQFSEVYESARPTAGAHFGESLGVAHRLPTWPVPYHSSIFQNENRLYGLPRLSSRSAPQSFLAGALWTRKVFNCDPIPPKWVTVPNKILPSRCHLYSSFTLCKVGSANLIETSIALILIAFCLRMGVFRTKLLA